MDLQKLAQRLSNLKSRRRQRRLLAEQVKLLSKDEQDQLADALKKQADQLMRSDIHRSLQVADLIDDLAEFTAHRPHRCLSLLAKANAYSIGLGEYQKGVEFYNEAAAIYADHGCSVEQARSQIGKVYALANLGRYDEALSEGEWASEILKTHGEGLDLARLTVNLAIIRGRLGQDAEALTLFDRARDFYLQLGDEGRIPLHRVELNRCIVLRNLGRFEASIAANERALAFFRQLGQSAVTAQAQQILAITLFVLGRYNEALHLLDQARDTFAADGRQRHAMLVELFTSDCLLQLRRFSEALEKCARVRQLFSEREAWFEVGEAILNEASAYVGLGRHDAALGSLAEARRLFEQEGNKVAVAATDLQVAAVLLLQDQPEQSLSLAQACATVFEAHELPIGQARACLVAARAAIALNQRAEAQRMVARVLDVAGQHDVPALAYQSHHLRGQLAVQECDYEEGLAAFERAILELERLCGRLMVEYRADFVEDKSVLYEDVVLLCLELNQSGLGLEYAERAKSRALLELLAQRIDLRFTARSAADGPLVDELLQLRDERDRLYRRRETDERMAERGATDQLVNKKHRIDKSVLDIERRITDLWHKLLVRNADYARDASLWQVRTEPIQPYLDSDTLLLEFFAAHGRLVAFLVTCDTIEALVLEGEVAQVGRLLQLLWLNLRAVPRGPQSHLAHLTRNAQGILKKLHDLVLGPFYENLRRFSRLIIVPHGPLHYLPFQALHDGEAYLIERHEICYLPGASVLRYCREVQPVAGDLLAVGHSYEGQLPFTVQEAKAVAELWHGQAILEEDATLDRFVNRAPQSRILHLATHGDFRSDNPLFSGLALSDGWLTTLDIFHLRLQTSLVTLSACQTGRSVVGGGDELLGLMRAFLSAGTASLVSTLWTVEDHSTAQLMQIFYENLAEGRSKGAALREAQLRFVDSSGLGQEVAHPYFWAPFVLAGDAGPV